MKTFNDLIPLKLYPPTDKLYIPIDKENKRKGSCIGILGNTEKSVTSIINSTSIINRNLYRSYYTEKSVRPIINNENADIQILKELSEEGIYYRITYNNIGIYEAFRSNISFEEWNRFKDSEAYNWLQLPDIKKYDNSYFTKYGYDKFMEIVYPIMINYIDKDKIIIKKYNDINTNNIVYKDEYQIIVSNNTVAESIMHKEEKNPKFRYMNGNTSSMKAISKYINRESVLEINRKLNNSVYLDGAVFNIYIYTKMPETKNRSNTFDIHVMSSIGFDEEREGPYEYYLKHELALAMITSLNPKINDYLATYIAMEVSEQVEYVKDINLVYVDGALVIRDIYNKKGPSKIEKIIIDNDIDYISKFAAGGLFGNIKKFI